MSHALCLFGDIYAKLDGRFKKSIAHRGSINEYEEIRLMVVVFTKVLTRLEAPFLVLQLCSRKAQARICASCLMYYSVKSARATMLLVS